MIAEVHKLPKVQRIRNFWRLMDQILKSMSVGMLNTVIETATYFLLNRLIPLFFCLAGICQVDIISGWNDKQLLLESHANFQITNLNGMFCSPIYIPIWLPWGGNAGVMAISFNILGLPEGISLFFATGDSFVWNFALN